MVAQSVNVLTIDGSVSRSAPTRGTSVVRVMNSVNKMGNIAAVTNQDVSRADVLKSLLRTIVDAHLTVNGSVHKPLQPRTSARSIATVFCRIVSRRSVKMSQKINVFDQRKEHV